MSGGNGVAASREPTASTRSHVSTIAGTTAINVLIEAIDDQGNVDGSKQTTVAPGQANVLELDNVTGSSRLHCKFTLIQGNKLNVRASYCIEDPNGIFCTATGDAR